MGVEFSRRYWGKANPRGEGGPRYHLLPYHNLDVAAVGRVLLVLDSSLRKRLSAVSGLSEKSVLSLVPFFLALHDLGKYSEGFQNLVPELFRELRGRESNRRYTVRHDSLGFLLWDRGVWEQLWKEDWFGLRRFSGGSVFFRECTVTVWNWARAVTGHHGEPPREVGRSGLRLNLGDHFGREEGADAAAFAKDVLSLFLTEGVPTDVQAAFTSGDGRNKAGKFSWLLAGFAVLCDWIGSDETRFPYLANPIPLSSYWDEYGLKHAETAVYDLGILPARISRRTGMKALFPLIETPSPLQEHASKCPLLEGPQLFILEDATGAGKTEAALTLAHRLMVAGHAEGLYVALPTMATANAMYDRLGEAYRRLFAESEIPSLVLAHSARHLSETFRQSILSSDEKSGGSYSQGDETATAQCSAWLADSRKKAMLADVGVGTVDQALLAVLPSRHQSLRLLGISRKVLVLDEVHAYDPYMLVLLKALLRFHAALGGSAVLLSATLPRSMRQQLVDSYCEGLGRESFPVESNGYPLVTHVGKTAEKENTLGCRPGAGMEISVSLRHEKADIAAILVGASRQGKCACWIRNTVADAIESHKTLEASIGSDNLLLFHARYAMGHRLKIEMEVRKCFGKESNASLRKGKVLIATQVVEQSLDLDFDVMVSDLATIDLLIQRAGRLHRHPRDAEGNPLAESNRMDQREFPRLYVFSPPPVEDPGADWFESKGFFPRASKVYPNHGQLWLTARMLASKGGWRIPEEARELVEGVFGESSIEEIPAGLAARQIRAEGQALANASLALLNALNFDKGYIATPGQWLDDTKAPTRLGEITTTVRLASLNGESISPFCSAERFAWELSQVSVRSALIHSESIDSRLQAVVEKAKESMPDHGKWSVLVPLEEVTKGVWRGKASGPDGQPVTVDYSARTGLTVARA